MRQPEDTFRIIRLLSQGQTVGLRGIAEFVRSDLCIRLLNKPHNTIRLIRRSSTRAGRTALILRWNLLRDCSQSLLQSGELIEQSQVNHRVNAVYKPSIPITCVAVIYEGEIQVIARFYIKEGILPVAWFNPVIVPEGWSKKVEQHITAIIKLPGPITVKSGIYVVGARLPNECCAKQHRIRQPGK